MERNYKQVLVFSFVVNKKLFLHYHYHHHYHQDHHLIINPHPTKWGPIRPQLIINIYHSSHGWTMCSRFKECVLMYKPP